MNIGVRGVKGEKGVKGVKSEKSGKGGKETSNIECSAVKADSGTDRLFERIVGDRRSGRWFRRN
jgi:hypothetical protein